MSPLSKTAAFFGMLATVSAHGFVQQIDVDGTQYTGYLVNQYPYSSDPPAVIGWTEDATDLGYVAPDAYATGDIICHKDATNGMATASVAAGGTVVLYWNTWPESHHGPVIDYLANCNGDCTTVDKTTLEFFKIDELGVVDGTTAPGTWATDNLIAANNSWTVTIPSTIAAGSYVLRHEIIALHSAGNSDGAQNYPQCINLEVTGGGSDAPAGTLGTALYTETDAGILFDIYTAPIDYTIPGPALYSSGDTGSDTTTAASSAAAVPTSVAASSAAAVPTSAAVSSAAAVPTTLATAVKASSTVPAYAAATSAAADAGGDDDECDA